jgi:[ribosomal protein S5]-alanine N-acetyltransferase
MIALDTPRLLLRPLTADDEPALFAVVGDEETMRWFPRPLTHAEVLEWIGKQQARYPSGTGLLGVVLKETGELIGDCGPVWHEVDGSQELEIGYHLRRDQWKRGFATEAARAVLDYSVHSLQKERCISLIRPENLPSRRVAERNGASLEKIVFWRDYDHCVYRYRGRAE